MAGFLDVDFTTDAFGKTKHFTLVESIANMITNMLILVPGTYPSLPELGFNIRKKMSNCLEGEFDVDAFKEELVIQCKMVTQFIDYESMEVYAMEKHGQGIIFITIPVTITDEVIYIGFQQEKESSTLSYNFEVHAKKLS